MSGHNCKRCGYHAAGRVVERIGDWLYRCPACGAYDWSPEPEQAPEGAPLRRGEARAASEEGAEG